MGTTHLTSRQAKVETSCLGCGQMFLTYASRLAEGKDKFCSRECYSRSRHIELVCARCGETFTRLRSSYRGATTFCSATCRNAALGEKESAKKSVRIAVSCATCGSILRRTRSTLEGHEHHFCNQRCLGIWLSENKAGENANGWKGGKIEVPCVFCGTALFRDLNHVNRHERQFCNIKCFGSWMSLTHLSSDEYRRRRAALRCEVCGKVVLRLRSQSKNSRHHFCGQKCWGKWYASTPHTSRPGPRVAVPCSTCGRELSLLPSAMTDHQEHFCNLECRARWMSKTMAGVHNPNWNRVDGICDGCGETLTLTPYRLKSHSMHFCDMQCRGLWQSRNMVGAAHPNWTGGGFNYYGPNWRQQRAAARARDGYTCQYCGRPERRLRRRLDVHHITPFRTFGYRYGVNDNYLAANNLSNLISLCSSCHKRAEHGKITIPSVILDISGRVLQLRLI